ncbi:uncharacterized protein [Onthophagus taurus]|uniref:uncharacterized protein n=1 Tax=Onthophagus taurus TaxID=166361 RepID=UPI0039BECE69
MKLINYFISAAIFFVAATFAAPTLPEETPKEIMNTFPIAPNDTESDSILAEDLNPKIIPEPIEEKNDEKMNQRMKKSATTTFCVEVKPNNPYQKPYELCESGNEIYAVPSDNSHYNAPAAPSPPVPVYGPPQKTYGTPVAPSNYVQSAPTSSSYKTATKTYENKKYRANEENELENSDEDDEFHDGMRSTYGTGYGYGGNVYGGGLTKKHKKHGHGHSGVVITCQPNLAGYASPAHAGYAGAGYGSGYGTGFGGAHGYAGGYRNSNPTEDVDQIQMKNMDYPRLRKSYNYENRNPSYGNYGYGPIPSRPNSYSSASATSFIAPHSIPNLAPQQIPNLIQPQIPLSGQYPAPSFPSPSFPSPSYQQTYSAPTTYPISSYGNNGASGIGYEGFKPQHQPQKGASFSSASAFVAPGTYRSTDNDKMEKMENKDMMMMKKMEDDHHWNQEMRSEGDQQQKETMANEEKM